MKLTMKAGPEVTQYGELGPVECNPNQVLDSILSALRLPEVARESLLLLGLAGAAAGIVGCEPRPRVTPKPGNPRVVTLERMSPECSLQGFVYPDGETLFVGHGKPFVTPDELHTLDINTAFVVPSALFAGWTEPGKQSRYNCHAFTLGEVAGITPDDWINGFSNLRCNNHNPVHDALSRFFDKAYEIPLRGRNIDERSINEMMHDGDRIFFARASGDSAEYVHSGIFMRIAGQNCLVHKLGEYPLTINSVSSVVNNYPEVFDRLEGYRPKTTALNK
jgi:hypothetical protein